MSTSPPSDPENTVGFKGARRLPDSGRERVAQLVGGGPWSSEQTVGVEATLRRIGFTSVGVVMGNVYSFNRASQAPPGYKPRKGMGYGAYGVLLDDPMSTKRSGGYVHDWSIDPRGGSRMDLGWTWERMIQEHRYRQVGARHPGKPLGQGPRHRCSWRHRDRVRCAKHANEQGCLPTLRDVSSRNSRACSGTRAKRDAIHDGLERLGHCQTVHARICPVVVPCGFWHREWSAGRNLSAPTTGAQQW